MVSSRWHCLAVKKDLGEGMLACRCDGAAMEESKTQEADSERITVECGVSAKAIALVAAPKPLQQRKPTTRARVARKRAARSGGGVGERYVLASLLQEDS